MDQSEGERATTAAYKDVEGMTGGKGVERKARGCVWLMELETELTIPARGP